VSTQNPALAQPPDLTGNLLIAIWSEGVRAPQSAHRYPCADAGEAVPCCKDWYVSERWWLTGCNGRVAA